MKNCVITSPLNLVYEPHTYNNHFLKISDLAKNTASYQIRNLFKLLKQ